MSYTKVDEARLEVSVALDTFVRLTINNVPAVRRTLGDRPEAKPESRREWAANKLFSASLCRGDDLSDLPHAITRALSVMDDIITNTMGPTDDLRQFSRKIAELGSILRIAQSHPDAALRRIKLLVKVSTSRDRGAA